MDIMIITHFTYDFSEKDNDRFLHIAKLLSENNAVEIITSDFYHTTKSYRNRTLAKWPFKVTFLHETGYNSNISIKRFYSHYVWGMNVKRYLKTRKNPDVVYCATPSLTAANVVLNYCKHNRIRFVLDIQDLWPESFKMIISIPYLSDLLFAPLNCMEHRLFRGANEICAVSETYVSCAKQYNKSVKGLAVYLGTDLGDFDSYKKKKPVLEKETGEFWVGYCGTLGSSYDINCVIDAISLVKEDGKSIKLIVMGDGPLRGEFEMHASQKGINALFMGRLPYDEMCSQLCQCDVVVNPIVGKSVASIINKHADYAASGLPVINTQKSTEYQNLITRYSMGFNCENGNSEEMAKCITKLISDKSLGDKMGKAARKCAEEKFDRRVTYPRLAHIITNE